MMKKRLLSLLLILSMVVNLLPAFTLPAEAAETSRNVMLGSDALAVDGSAYLYYGRQNGSPFLWRVLSDTPSDYQSYTDANTNTRYSKGSGYRLVSQINAFSTQTRFLDGEISDGTIYTYENSNLRTQLKAFQASALNDLEQSYLLPTTIVATHTGGPSGKDIKYERTSDMVQVIIPNEKVFEIGEVLTDAREKGQRRYWLRDTTHVRTVSTEVPVGYYDSNASAATSGTWNASNTDAFMRPSVNLDAKIGLLTSLTGKPAIGAGLQANSLYSEGKWVPTMIDSTRTGFTAGLSSSAVDRSTGVTISYDGAYTDNGDIMVLLLQNGAIRQTARFATTTESGSVILNTGTIAGSYEVKIFAERCPADSVAVMSNVADAGALTVNVSTDTAVEESVTAINTQKPVLAVAQTAFAADQKQAIADVLNAWLLEHVNEGTAVTSADINITHVAPAQAGDSSTPAGTNGEVTFTPTIEKVGAAKKADSLTWTVTATAYTGLTDADAVSQAAAAVKTLNFDVNQSEGNTEEELRTLMAEKINKAVGTYGISVLTSQLITSSFTAAAAGTADVPAGTNGSFAFRVKLTRGSVSNIVDSLAANISATPYTAAGGLGTTESPYILTTQADLHLLAAYPDKCFKLGANITITQAEGTYWTPLGSFSGTLDGDGYSISGLKLGVSADQLDTGGIKRISNQGFFTFLTSTATVKNLTFVSPELPLKGVRKISSSYQYTDAGGFLADSNAGTIQNCRVEDAMVNLMSDLTSHYDCGGLEHFGGLVNVNTGTVKDCAVEGITIIIPAYTTGNIGSISIEHYPQLKAIGGMIGENSGTVTGCTVTGLYMPNPKLWCSNGGKPAVSTSTALTIGATDQNYSYIPAVLGVGGLIGYQNGTCDHLSGLYVNCTVKTLGSQLTGSPYYLARDGWGYYEKNVLANSNSTYREFYTTNGAVVGYVQRDSGVNGPVSVPDTLSAGVTAADSAVTAEDAHHSVLAGGSNYGTDVIAANSHSLIWNGSTAAGTYTISLKDAGGTLLRSYTVTKGEKLTLTQIRLADGTIVTGWKDAAGKTYTANAEITVVSDLTLTASGSQAGTLFAVDTTNKQKKEAGKAGSAYVPVFTGSPADDSYILTYRLTDRADLTWSNMQPANAGIYDVKVSPKDPSLWTASVYTITEGLTLTGTVPAGRITLTSANATRIFSNQPQTVTADQLDFDHTGVPAANITNIRYQSGTETAAAAAPTESGTYQVLADITASAPFTATSDYVLGTMTILTAAQSALTRNVFLKYSNTTQQTVSIASLLPADIGTDVTYYAGYPTYSKAVLFAMRPTCSTTGVVSYQLADNLTTDNIGQTAIIPVTVTSRNYSPFTINVSVSAAGYDDCSDSIVFPDVTRTYNGTSQKYETAALSDGFTAGKDGVWTYTYYTSWGTAYSDGNSPTLAGTYSVKADYADSLYKGSRTAKLTITKADDTLTNKTSGGYSTTQVYGSVSEPVNTQFVYTSYADNQVGSISTEWYQNGVKLSGKPVNAGTYQAKVTSAETANIKAASVTLDVTISKKPVTITAMPQSIPYAGSLSQSPSKVTASVLAEGDTVSAVTLSTTDINVTTAGTITVQSAVIKKGETDVTDNYAVTYAAGTLTITQSTPVITFKDNYTGKVYDGTPMAVPTEDQLNITGAYYSDVVFEWIGKNATLATAPVTTGNYTAEAVIRYSANTQLATATRDISITAKKIIPTLTLVEGDNYTYNGYGITPSVTVSYNGSTLAAGTDYTVSYSNNVNVGTADVTIAPVAGGNSNYTFEPVTQHFTINIAEASGLTVAVDKQAYIYWTDSVKVTVTNSSNTNKVFQGTTAKLYYGDTVLATADFYAGFTLQYKTADKLVPTGTNIPLTVRITGTNINTITLNTSITLNKYPIGVDPATLKPLNRSFIPGDTSVGVDSSVTPALYSPPNVNDQVQLDTTNIKGTMDNDKAGNNKTVTFTGFALKGKDAAFYKLSDSSNTITKENLNGVTISPASITPTVVLSESSFVYNGSKQVPTVTLKDGNIVLPESEYWFPYTYGGTNVGSYTITIRAQSSGNYTFSDLTPTYEITKANLTPPVIIYQHKPVNASGDTYEYGTSIDLYAQEGVGLLSVVSGEDIVTLKGASTIQFNKGKLGPVTVRMTVSKDNYNDITADYTFTVVKGTPELSNIAAASPAGGKYYTNTDPSTINITGTAVNKLNTAVTGTFTLAPGVVLVNSLVSGTSSYPCIFTPTGTDAELYKTAAGKVSIHNIAEYEPTTLSVAKKDETSSQPSRSYVFGDRFSMDNLKFTVHYSDSTTKEVPASEITLTYPNTNKDYNFFYDIGSEKSVTFTYTEGKYSLTARYDGVSVSKKPIDISGIALSGYTFTFNGKQRTVTLNMPVPEGVNISMTGTTSAKDVGSYTARLTFSLAAGYTDKYSLFGTNPKTPYWMITKADAPSISEQSVSYRYFNATTGDTFDFASLLPADRGTTTYSMTNTTNGIENVVLNQDTGVLTYDTKKLTAAATDTVTVTATMKNYETATITLHVNLTDKYPVTIDLSGITLADKTYDGRTLSYSGSAAGTYSGGTYSGGFDYKWYQGSTEVSAPVNAGSYTLKVSVRDTSNYTGEAQKNVTISPLTASLGWADTQFTYNGSVHTPTASVTNAVSGDVVNVTVTGGQTAAGTYTAAATGFTGAAGANYQLPETTTVNYVINKAGTSMTLDVPSSVTYGDTITITAHMTPVDAAGLVYFYGNDVLLGSVNLTGGSASISYNIAAEGALAIGANTISVRYDEGSSYTAASAAAAVTMNPKPVGTVSISPISAQTYTGSPVTPSVTVKDGASTLTFGTDYTVSYSNNTNAGTGIVTITGRGRYTGTKEAEFTILPAAADYASVSTSVYYSDTSEHTVSLADAVSQFRLAGDTLVYGNTSVTGEHFTDTLTVDANGILHFTLQSGLAAKETVENVTLDVTGFTNYKKVTVTATILLKNKKIAAVVIDAGKTSGVTYGDSVTYTATLDKEHTYLNGSDQPDGEISFYLDGSANNGTLLDTKSVSGSGSTASITLNRDRLTAGSHTITAVYSGNTDFAGVSAAVSTTVAKKVLTWDVSGLWAAKQADEKTDAEVNGRLAVSGALDGTDPGFTYSALTGIYDSAAAGNHTVTVTVTDGQLTNGNYALPAGTPVFTGAINAVTPLPGAPAPSGGTTYRLEQEKGISTVPEALQNDDKLNTPEKIAALMRVSVTDNNSSGSIPVKSIEVYDVALQYSTDNGKTWQDATEKNFPATGITILLPYPSGTSKDNFDFVITHMRTTGSKAGTIENVPFEKTAEGLKFTLYSLSPVAVGYKAAAAAGGIVIEQTHTITTSAGAGGSFDTAAAVQVRNGESARFNIKPDAGYSIADVMVDGKSVGAVSSYTFTNVTGDHSISATFKKAGTAGGTDTGTTDPDTNTTDTTDTTGTTDTETTTSPKTGDSSNPVLWLSLASAGLLGLAVTFTWSRRRKQDHTAE